MYTLVCTCAHACIYSCVVQALGPWEYSWSFSRAHIAMNGGWLAVWPAANTFSKWLAVEWLHWCCPVNRLWWRDLSRSQLEAMPMLLSKMHFPCVWFSKQAGNEIKLVLLISYHNSSGHQGMIFFFPARDWLKCRILFCTRSVIWQFIRGWRASQFFLFWDTSWTAQENSAI